MRARAPDADDLQMGVITAIFGLARLVDRYKGDRFAREFLEKNPEID